MAISVSAAAVIQGSGATAPSRGTAGETVTAGQVIYLKAADNRLWLAQADGTAAEAEAVGIALHGASAGQPLSYHTSGLLGIAASGINVGEILYVSASAGTIDQYDDVTGPNKITFLGYGYNATTIYVLITITGLAHP